MKNLLYIIILTISIQAQSQHFEIFKNLKGEWDFSIGDNYRWASTPQINQSWVKVNVPASWESQGFRGYDGFAWYKKDFYIDNLNPKNTIYLLLGNIDDADEVFINGLKIGSTGSMPPKYSTGYNINRVYKVPFEYINLYKKNTITVRVFDYTGDGGISSGNKIGLCYDIHESLLTVNLDGKWKFKTGDNNYYSDAYYDDSDWKELNVPERWDSQGYKHFDGVAWYRKTFTMPDDAPRGQYYITLGYIDDEEVVFFNGKKIGSTKDLKHYSNRKESNWKLLRVYPVPENLMYYHRKNVISVRVKDYHIDGGIYDGHTGLLHEANYRHYMKYNYKPPTFWDVFWEMFDD